MLRRSNATVGTTTNPPSGAKVAKLTNQRAMIGPPQQRDMEVAVGGQVRYVVALDPGLDIHQGDLLYITAWGDQVVDPTNALFVLRADPAGGGDLTIIRCLVGDRLLRGGG